MTALVLYDDAIARAFEPFALTRPVSELRAGTELLRRRWERALGVRATAFLGATHLVDFEELDAPPAAQGELARGTVLANARCAAELSSGMESSADAEVWTCAGRVAAVRLTRAVHVDELRSGELTLDTFADLGHRRVVELNGWWIDDVWDLIRHLQPMLASDIQAWRQELDTAPASERGAAVLGDGRACVEAGATIEPYVVFDTTNGPILVRRGATVSAFTRLVGPCYVGPDALIGGGRIALCAIGEHARMHGEMSLAVVLGHSNKAHEGFVGHSYLGRWVNLGASTVTSNLKNTYGSVALWTPSGLRDTGMQFLGTLFGDHAKTAIGTRLTTGSVIGAGANVFGAAMTPKVVRPFAWGTEGTPTYYDADRFIRVAERVMGRRNVTLGDGARRTLAAAHAAARSAPWKVE